MVSKEPKFFKSFHRVIYHDFIVLRLPFRVIDLTAYSGDLWYSFKSCSVWCFLFVTLFNLQGTRRFRRNICYFNIFHFVCQVLFSKFFDFFDPDVSRSNFIRLPHSQEFVKHFFEVFSKFGVFQLSRRLIGDSLVRIPRVSPFVNTFFQFSFAFFNICY